MMRAPFRHDSRSFAIPPAHFVCAQPPATGTMASSGVMSTNENDQYNALIQYQVRKLNFTSGYSRLEQGFSSSGMPPEVLSSYYMGVSRWFNFF